MRKRHLSEKEFERRKREIKYHGESLLREQELKILEDSYKSSIFPKKIQTTKILISLLYINCVVVEIYTMWVMYKLCDLSALGGLISCVIGETVGFGIYCLKSYKETQEEEKIKLERDKMLSDEERMQDIPLDGEQDTYI